MPDGDLSNRELDTLEIFLTAKAQRTAITLEEYIQSRVIQGATKEAIKADLLADLEGGGRIFGEFRNAVRATSNGTVNRFRDTAIFQELGTEQNYRWAAVLVKTCPDCMDRHGKVKKWDEWEADGLPRTGQTVCKENCRCMLIPEEFTVLEPIMRKGGR